MYGCIIDTYGAYVQRTGLYYTKYFTTRLKTIEFARLYFLYHICKVFIRLTFFCSCRTPYINASAVGGQPEKHKSSRFVTSFIAKILLKVINENICTRDIYIDRDNAIATPNNWIGVMIVASPISTTTHRNYPTGFRHLKYQNKFINGVAIHKI